MSHNKKYSCHHLIPKNNDDWSKFTENKINKEIISDRVLNFNKQILNDEFVKELLKVLDKYIYNYYKIETHIIEELWSLLEIEKEYFTKKK